MNKYLYNKIEQTNSAYFENIVFMANEMNRESESESFEDFQNLNPLEITKVLGWNNKEETLKLIKDSIKEKEFASLLFRYDITGFLAECHIPESSGFKFKKGEDKPTSWSVHTGICRIEWIYAESIGELVEKLVSKSEDIFKEYYEKEKKAFQ